MKDQSFRTPEWRKKISDSLKGRKKPPITEKHRENLRLSHLGKKPSDETRKKMSLAQMCNTRGFTKEWHRTHKHPRLGVPHTEEAKEKIRSANSGERAALYKHGLSYTPEYVRWKTKRYLQRVKENGGAHSKEDFEKLKREYNFTCPSCKKAEPEILLEHDHITPLSKGGNSNIENIQPLCGTCNRKKRVKTVRYFYE